MLDDRNEYVVQRPVFNSEVFKPGKFISVKWKKTGTIQNGVIYSYLPHQINYHAFNGTQMDTYAISISDFLNQDMTVMVIRGYHD